MEKSGNPINGMIALEVPDDELKKRLIERGKTSGRSDDQNINKINNRIQVYKDETIPVAKYYSQKGQYVAIHGVGKIEDIFTKISEAIDSLK
jgi:adenylate kinase